MVAKLWIDQKKLKFQWTDEAKDDNTSNYLRNCAISLLTGASAIDLKLRAPAKLDPIVLDFEKGAVGEASAPKLDWLPDQSSIKVEVVGIEGQFPEHRFDPAKEFPASKGSTNILIGPELILAGGEKLNASLIELEGSLGRSVQVKATLNVNYPPARGKGRFMPSRYVDKKVDGVLGQLAQQKAGLLQLQEEYNKIKDNGEKEKFNRNLQIQTGIVNLPQATKDLDAVVKEYENFKNQYVEQMKACKIKVRIYHTVGDAASGEYQVVLAE
jgi:hypothetical protein